MSSAWKKATPAAKTRRAGMKGANSLPLLVVDAADEVVGIAVAQAIHVRHALPRLARATRRRKRSTKAIRI